MQNICHFPSDSLVFYENKIMMIQEHFLPCIIILKNAPSEIVIAII